MSNDKTMILNESELLQKIKRIAYEIYEQNSIEKEIILAGIYDKGYRFSQLLMEHLCVISTAKITLVKVNVDKFAPLQSTIELDIDVSYLKHKTIILIDDVLNTGRTMAYSLKPFLTTEIKKLQTAVIVDRENKTFPVLADFVGYKLSTTLKDTIDVEFDGITKGVFIY